MNYQMLYWRTLFLKVRAMDATVADYGWGAIDCNGAVYFWKEQPHFNKRKGLWLDNTDYLPIFAENVGAHLTIDAAAASLFNLQTIYSQY